MSVKQGDCASWVELTPGETAALASVADAMCAMERRNWCEREAGHSGRHVSFAQSGTKNRTATTWWIWWPDGKGYSIMPANPCPALREDHDPGSDSCLLPAGHTGHHSF